jgi:hypothetical protein
MGAMDRPWRALVVLLVAAAGCGGDGDRAASSSAAVTPTATETATATATPTTTPDIVPSPKPGTCDEVEYEPKAGTEFTHPDSNFYEPDATTLPTPGDLDHLLLEDNAVVVTYAADIKRKTRDRLYDWTYADVVERTPIVLPDASADALTVRARIATVELRCNGWDFKRLTKFANRKDIAPLPRKG